MGKRMNNVARNLVISLALGAGLAGCGATIGPRVETRYVVQQPGVPVVVLENATVTCRVLTDVDGAAVQQDIGGWVAMPPAHWDQVKRDLLTKGH